MCGILTVISKTDRSLNSSKCKRALSTLSNRGPDFRSDFIFENRTYFGQTILSLTGMVGSDPSLHLKSKSDRYRILFNGEIYNFKELNSLGPILTGDFTDSEVLVNLFDSISPIELQQKLDGMYAYAILDERDKQIHFARDPQGEKSLFVFEDENFIVASSEIGPIRAMMGTLKLEPDVFRDYFHTRHFMYEEKTPYKNLRQLRPGDVWTFDLLKGSWKNRESMSPLSWIDESEYQCFDKMSDLEMIQHLDESMNATIQEMIPSGRQFSAVVSGGIDSSLISKYLCEHSKPQTLVAVNHVGKDHISDDLAKFERAFDRKIERLDVDLLKYAWEIPRCQSVLGSPLLSHSFIGQSVQSEFVRRQGSKALFGGEGGDELFGGYDAYLKVESDLDSKFSPSPYTAWKSNEYFSNHESSLSEELSQLWTNCLDRYAFIKDEKERKIQAAMAADFIYQLPAVGLRGADLMSMMWSLETRSVLVRRPLVKIGLNLPLKFKIRPEAIETERTKWLLKQVFKLKFSKDLILKKQGFSGFPNEAGRFLGDREDFLSLDFLGLNISSARTFDRASEWKLINIEYFLRNHL